MTAQNHSYAIDVDSLKGTPLELTHINLLDNTAEGIRCKEQSLLAVQYHPESCPGPQDSGYLFGSFIDTMQSFKEQGGAAHA